MNIGTFGMWVSSIVLGWAGGNLVTAAAAGEPGPVLVSGAVSIYAAGLLVGLVVGEVPR
jgi:hypothetical protein